MRILVVDDDKLLLMAIAQRLTSDGFSVTTVENGFEALMAIETLKYDLVITDIMMPEISGLSMLSMLKKFYFNNVPVIVISSLNKADVILNTMELGAVDFLVKPINFDDLIKLVRKHLKVPEH